MGFLNKILQAQRQSQGEVPAPAPRPTLIQGGPAFFTPEGYTPPIQPEQAFMPTDVMRDPIADMFAAQPPLNRVPGPPKMIDPPKPPDQIFIDDMPPMREEPPMDFPQPAIDPAQPTREPDDFKVGTLGGLGYGRFPLGTAGPEFIYDDDGNPIMEPKPGLGNFNFLDFYKNQMPKRDDFMSIGGPGGTYGDRTPPSVGDGMTDPSLAAAVIAPPIAPPKPLGEDVPFIPPAMPPMIPNPVQSVTTPQPIAQTPRPVQEPVEMTTVTRPNLLGEMQTVNIGNYNLPSGPVSSPTNIGMQIPDTPIGGISAVENPFIQLPTPPMRDDFMSIERLPIGNNPPFMMEEGKQIPDDAKGLQALAKTEKGKDAVRQMGFELQMGGMAPSPDEIQQLQMAVLGQIPNNDEVISMFIDKYGNEIFMMIREQILNPEGNRQTQGMIEGMGSGMDDQVLGMIGSQQPVAVSPGEYIVPADVVSGLGDGSSDAGAKELDGLLDRVRQERTNTTKQPKELNKGKVLPK